MVIDKNVIVLIIIIVAGLLIALTGEDSGSSRDWNIILWLVVSIILTLVWGGIFWW